MVTRPPTWPVSSASPTVPFAVGWPPSGSVVRRGWPPGPRGPRAEARRQPGPPGPLVAEEVARRVRFRHRAVDASRVAHLIEELRHRVPPEVRQRVAHEAGDRPAEAGDAGASATPAGSGRGGRGRGRAWERGGGGRRPPRPDRRERCLPLAAGPPPLGPARQGADHQDAGAQAAEGLADRGALRSPRGGTVSGSISARSRAGTPRSTRRPPS